MDEGPDGLHKVFDEFRDHDRKRTATLLEAQRRQRLGQVESQAPEAVAQRAAAEPSAESE